MKYIKIEYTTAFNPHFTHFSISSMYGPVWYIYPHLAYVHGIVNVGKYTDIHGSWIVCPSPTKVVYWYMKDGKLSTRILDMSIGPGFSCSWEDLNNDPGWKVR